MKNRYTLKYYPKGRGREVYRVIEISGQDTLDTLCEAIMDSFEFDMEHLYEFCMDNRMYSQHSYQCRPLFDFLPSTRIELGKLGLVPKQKFSLHYDFGDDWMFTIGVQKIEPEGEYAKPVVLKERGRIIQYPDYEDEDEEWEDEDF